MKNDIHDLLGRTGFQVGAAECVAEGAAFPPESVIRIHTDSNNRTWTRHVYLADPRLEVWLDADDDSCTLQVQSSDSENHCRSITMVDLESIKSLLNTEIGQLTM